MQALLFEGPNDVRHGSVADPELRAPTDVIVRVERAAICGSDLHAYRGLETGLDPGTAMGHEFAGEVVEAGTAVRRLRPGARVISPFTTSCGTCWYCRAGLTSRCTAGQLFGWVTNGAGLQGGQAQLVRVPLADTTLVEAPADLPLDIALLAGDVLATGFHGAQLAAAGPGQVVAVIGCGAVGLMAAVGALALGAERVFAIDSVPERLALAQGLGAEPLALAASAELGETLREATGGRGADAVIEAVGSAAATRLAFDLLRPGGTLAAVGVHTERHLAFAPGEAYDKNLTYRAGRAPVRALLDRMLALAGSRRFDLGAIISHRIPLADGPAAYAMFDQHRDGCTKVLLLPG